MFLRADILFSFIIVYALISYTNPHEGIARLDMQFIRAHCYIYNALKNKFVCKITTII